MAFTNLVNYVKKVWKDAPSTDTPINAVNLNHMENGIADAASAINQLGQNLTAGDNLRFQFSKSGNKYGYKDANGNFVSFKTAHTGTYTASSRGSALDMGEDHANRYVNTNNVPNTNSGTYSVTSNGTKDMGATNSYRYLNVNIDDSVVNKLVAKWGTFNSYFGNSISGLTVGGIYLVSYTRISEASAWPYEGCTVIKGNNLTGGNQNLFFGIVKATKTYILFPGDNGNDIAYMRLE